MSINIISTKLFHSPNSLIYTIFSWKGDNKVYVLESSLPTTQHCFHCGTDTKHEPFKRVFVCSCCGYEEDRDIHAAKNMIRFYHVKNKTR